MTQTNFNQDLLDFLAASPTPFHATAELSKHLNEEGFIKLNESDIWSLNKGERYFLTKNDSSLIAFVYGNDDINVSGISMIGAHTDSPCLKLKPNTIIHQKGYKIGRAHV